ncbi:TPA_asm: aryl-sulfate sulfotransferase [Salmonella enterica subsp. salamae serovar 60:g,m,t:z6]|uniref:Aryl-sulfate sulfotransferase n=1 Tax=Salmonella enterica subsp. houtenae serovar 1,40:z4,z32:- TaxID=1967604 RepID=A0A730ZL23_SALHO|nr:aryl-sulfate sulfotransferase [Salmonella enterica]HAC6696791.1 arylsulfatase [Salmonella bongori serovar 66:z65:-]HAE2268385.1 aryl-sulfate sulfotransferase [Salmonella enterica subsp. enterica serovar 1,9,12:-:-]HAE4187164.1 aryl-sulfate sulfotransferase [Salmonella enterica subsp. houtenae serovar 1,40:z4,z32:-]HAE7511290.1 aryl-sulfate sulfotransferase [Salmonella enterica subsp. salamae serovar 60:g,m,t:z6]
MGSFKHQKNTLPAPRPAINQGIDTQNAMVLNHTAIYEHNLSQIAESNTVQNALIVLNPFTTAPLSAWAGIWSVGVQRLTLRVEDVAQTALPVIQNVTLAAGANLLPVLGLVADTDNRLTILEDGVALASYIITTQPLPATDSAEVQLGFPIISVTQPTTEADKMAPGCYFITHFDRYNYALDQNGVVRWYVTQDFPSYNLVRLDNGHFLATSEAKNTYLDMYEFDMMGRLHTFYVLDNQFHHSIWQWDSSTIVAPSEYTAGRPDDLKTNEDGVSVVDLSTGLETAYYDLATVLDVSRPSRPSGTAPGEDPDVLDWLHINQSYVNDTNNLLVASGRHQSAVFGVDLETQALRFILSTHEAWSQAYQPYLLTPVDAEGNPLYDFSRQEDIDAANSDFWTWGQHNVVEIANDEAGIVEFMVFDNGNYRSRDDSKSLLPPDNFSRIVRFVVDLNTMTVTRPFEYGKELGARGYSSCVSAKEIQANGNIVVHFADCTFDENGRAISCEPGDSDLLDPQEGSEAMGNLILQEIDPASKTVLFEAMMTSGYYKNEATNGEGYRYDITSFRVYKMGLYA